MHIQHSVSKRLLLRRDLTHIGLRALTNVVLELQCTYGIPQYHISEITNPAGDDVDQEQLDESNNVRNSLLVYKLLHYYDKIPNIKINLKNREKQLFKPLLRVFQDSKIFDTILKTVSVFVGEKRQARSHTLTAFLCELVSDLVVNMVQPWIPLLSGRDL